MQLASSGRGFSFRTDEPLDMRFDPTLEVPTAAELLNSLAEGELERTLREYGEEPRARRVARSIVYRRAQRPFERTDDLVAAIYPLLMSDEHEPVNLGNPDIELTMNQLTELINKLAGNPAGIVYQDLRSADDPQVRRPDITKARRVLNWEARVSAEEGMRRTIEWFTQRMKSATH